MQQMPTTIAAATAAAVVVIVVVSSKYHRKWIYEQCCTATKILKIRNYKSQYNFKLESSQSLHTTAKAMLFARWQHHLRFCSGFPYAPLKAMVMKISKWSRIQDSFRITPKIESLAVCAMPDIPSEFQKDPSITFWVILYTHTHTDRQTNKKQQLSLIHISEPTRPY